MKTTFFTLAVMLALCSGCKKSYTCSCTSPGTTTDIFTQNGRRSDAEKKCTDYYNGTYANIPLNETSCKIR